MHTVPSDDDDDDIDPTLSEARHPTITERRLLTHSQALGDLEDIDMSLSYDVFM